MMKFYYYYQMSAFEVQLQSIEIRCFPDFVTLKMLFNKHKFAHLLQVAWKGKAQDIFADCNVFINILKCEEWSEIKKCLKNQGIRVQQSNEKSQNGLLKFKEFSSLVFASPHKYSLLKTSFTLWHHRDCLASELFSNDKRFQIEKIGRQCVGDKSQFQDDDWFLIIDTKATVSLKQDFFECEQLIKMTDIITVNLHKFYSIFSQKHANQIMDEKAFELQINLKFVDFMKSLKFQGKILVQGKEKDEQFIQCECWYVVDFNLQFILKIKAPSHQGLVQTIQNFYQQGYGACIEWAFNPINYLKDVRSLIKERNLYITMRIKSNLTDLSITKQGKRINQINNILTSLQQQNQASSQNEVIQINLLQFIKDTFYSKKYDISSLNPYWPYLTQLLNDMLLNWQMYKYEFQDTLKQIINILEYKLYKFRVKKNSKTNQKDIINAADLEKRYFYLLEYLYPKISYFVNEFNTLLGLKTISEKINIQIKKKELQANISSEVNPKGEVKSQSNNVLKEILEEMIKSKPGVLKIEENFLDKLMMDYFAELDSLSQGKGKFYVKIGQSEKRPLQGFIGQIIGYQRQCHYWEDAFNIITINMSQFLEQKNDLQQGINQISYQKLPNTTCLGCTQFFVLNKSIANNANRVPLRLFPNSPKNYINNELIQEIIFMLNNIGGVILFNCSRQYGSILPKGSFITQVQKENNQNLIQDIIKKIEPIVKYGQNIIVSFVPVIQYVKIKKPSHFKREKQSQATKIEESSIENLFVMRIKVFSKDRNSVFKHKNKTSSNEQSQNIASNEQSKKDEPNKFTPSTFRNPLNHKCKEVKVFEITKINLEKAFPFASMIVVKTEHLPKIKTKLQQKGVRCFIQTKFDQYKFSIAKYTAVMYHEDKFEDIIKNLTNNPDIIIDGKRVLAIFITSYLKIESDKEISQKDIENAMLWLEKEFPNDSLKYFHFKKIGEKQVKQHYIKTESKLSTLFMYYVFNHFKVKTVFKNPPSESIKDLIEIPLIRNSESSIYEINQISNPMIKDFNDYEFQNDQQDTHLPTVKQMIDSCKGQIHS